MKSRSELKMLQLSSLRAGFQMAAELLARQQLAGSKFRFLKRLTRQS